MSDENQETAVNQAVGGVVGLLHKILDAVLGSPVEVAATVAVAANGEQAVHAMAQGLNVVRAGVVFSADRWLAAVRWFGRRWFVWIPSFILLTGLWGYLTYTAGTLGGDEGRMRAVLAMLVGLGADFSAFGIIGALAYWAQVTLQPVDWAREVLFRIGVVRRDPQGDPVFDAAMAKKVLWHFLMVKALFVTTLIALPNAVTVATVLGILFAFIGMISVAKTLKQRMDIGYKILYGVYAVFALVLVKVGAIRILLPEFYASLVQSRGALSKTLAFITDHGWTRTVWECWVEGMWVVGKDGLHWDAIHIQPIGTNLLISGQYEQHLYALVALVLCLGVLGSMTSSVALFVGIVRGHVWSEAGYQARQQAVETVLVAREVRVADRPSFPFARIGLGLLVVVALFIGGCYGCKAVTAMAAATPAAPTTSSTATAPTPPASAAPTLAPTPTTKTAGGAGQAKPANRKLAEVGEKVRKDLKKFEE